MDELASASAALAGGARAPTRIEFTDNDRSADMVALFNDLDKNFISRLVFSGKVAHTRLWRMMLETARADASHVLYAKRYMYRSISHSLHLCYPPLLLTVCIIIDIHLFYNALQLGRRWVVRKDSDACGVAAELLAALKFSRGKDAGEHAC